MTNDIRKNIMLIENIILDESFKDAQRKFSSSTSSEEVKSYIDKFKELSKRNIIKGQDKDIGTWIKGDWVDFKKFVDSNSIVVTKRQTKAIQKKDSIVVYKDDIKQVVIPLTKEASIHYGRNTDWCTAYTKAQNQFPNYFYIKGITLFYVLFKNGNKYACAFHPDHPDTIECFDQLDKSMVFGKFEKATGISKKDIQNWYGSNKTKIENSQDLNKVSEEVQIGVVTQDGRTIRHIDNPSERLQQIAAVTKDGNAIEHIDNPSEEIQLLAVKNNPKSIQHIDNPSEKVQLVVVEDNIWAIDDIDNPTERVQMVVVNQDSDTIEYINNPTEEVQLIAVRKNIWSIKHIDNPSKEIQLIVVKQNGYVIGSIDNPSEEVQLAAVKRTGGAIERIINKGITPSEEVQMAAVNQDAYAIKHIDNPSEEVQMAAVNHVAYAIEHIDNPTEKVQLIAINKSGMNIEYINNPTEEVQLIAVRRSEYAIQHIDNPSEKVKALHNKLWER